MRTSIIIAGDFCPRFRTAELFEKEQYEEVLHEVVPYVSNCDYSIVNFECAIANGTNAKPIKKCGPAISCSEEGVKALQYAGFKCLTLANNHFGDYGDEGSLNTLEIIKKNKFDYVGGGKNLSEAQKVLYKKVRDFSFAIVNVCEHEFTIADNEHAGSAPLDVPVVVSSILEAKRNADKVIVIVHGGNEFFQLPTPRMKKTYRCFVECGADVVLNHHQHCFGGYEIYQGKPIFYGLGNFCFDSTTFKGLWNEGYMVKLLFGDKIDFELIPYSQCSEQPTINIYDGEKKEKVLNKVKELNEIIADDNKLEAEYKKFYPSCFPGMRMSITPYTSRIPYSLCLRHLIPSFITEERKRLIYAYVNCESHRDIFLEYLKLK